MKSFVALLAAVLVTIGIGVGIESTTTTSTRPPAQHQLGLALSRVPTPNSPCPIGPITLSVNDVIPSVDLAAISFYGANDGVGVTTSELSCVGPHNSQMPSRAFPVRLTYTTNGGHTWKLLSRSSPPNVRHIPYQPIAMVFPSKQQGWLSANGRLEHTTDGGGQWTPVRLDTQPVFTIARAGDSILAVTFKHMHMWTMSLSTGHWIEGAAIPTVKSVSSVPTTVFDTALGPNPDNAIVATGKYGDAPPEIATTSDGGSHWSVRSDPCKGPTWITLQALAESPEGTIALLCGGGAAAGSATRGFYVSTSRGASWTEEAADTDLARTNVSGIPLQDFGDALLAQSSNRYVLAFGSGFVTSTDGGKDWTSLPIAGPLGSTAANPLGAGGESTYDVRDVKHVWMLVPGVGLFRTTDDTDIWRSA